MTKYFPPPARAARLAAEALEPAEAGQRVQLRAGLAGLDYAAQLSALQPPVPAVAVQARQSGSAGALAVGDSDAAIRATAQQGLVGTPASLPHLDRIQTAFGSHDVGQVRAFVGGPAARASQTIGAAAYASGDAIAFEGAPDLHTAAHEAAHVVQQRKGVSLPGGVGQIGDAFEQHADAVADRVVQGKSAESLLEPFAAPDKGAGNRPIQAKGGIGGFLKAAGDFVSNPKKAIYDMRLAMEGRQEEVLGAAQQVSNQDIILEQLAHAGAYGRLDPSKLGPWGYLEAGRVDDPESGFHCVLYQPTPEALANATDEARIIQVMHGGPPPPVLAFAGTNPKEKRDISDDTTKAGVGAYQFASNIGKVGGVMASAGGKLIVTGHSLGGALAQHAAVNFPGNVSRVVTFQSPGIAAEDVAKLQAYNEKAAPKDKVKSTHHRAEGDLVHAAGEALTEGEVFEYSSVGVGNPADHMAFPLARLAAARGNLIPGMEGDSKAEDKLVKVKKSTTAEVKGDVANKVAEWGRVHLGAVARDKDMGRYVTVWKDIQTMAQSGDYSLKYVQGCISSSSKLTDVQKIKMRDAVNKMWAEVLG